MGATSVVTIDIESQEFEAFLKEFQGWQTDLDALPDGFKAIGKKMDAAFGSGTKSVKSMGEEAKKQVKNVGLFEKAWDRVANRTKAIEKSITNFSKGITTIIPGLGMASLMAGGLIGLPTALFAAFTGLQNWSANERTRNIGTGSSQGNRTAFNNQMKRYGIDDSFLGNLETLKTRQDMAGTFFTDTGLYQNQARDMDNVNVAFTALDRMRGYYQRGEMALAQRLQGDLGLNTSQYQNVVTASDADYSAVKRRIAETAPAFEISDASQKKSQDFQAAWDDIISHMKTTFVNVSNQLQGPMLNLTTAFDDLLTKLANRGTLKEWIDKATDGLTRLGNYLTSDEFKKDMQTATDDIKAFAATMRGIGDGIYTLMNNAGLIKDPNLTNDEQAEKDKETAQGRKGGAIGGALTGALLGGSAGSFIPIIGTGVGAIGGALVGGIGGWYGGGYTSSNQFYDEHPDVKKGPHTAFGGVTPMAPTALPGPLTDAKYKKLAGPDEAAADALTGVPDIMARTFQIESHGNPNAVSRKGARGFLQWMPGTDTDNHVTPGNLDSERKGWLEYYGKLLKKYHNDIYKAAAAYNFGPGNLDKTIDAYRDKWRDHIPAETRNYVSFVVDNRTGTDINTGLAGMSYMPQY